MGIECVGVNVGVVWVEGEFLGVLGYGFREEGEFGKVEGGLGNEEGVVCWNVREGDGELGGSGWLGGGEVLVLK